MLRLAPEERPAALSREILTNAVRVNAEDAATDRTGRSAMIVADFENESLQIKDLHWHVRHDHSGVVIEIRPDDHQAG
jgi:hypothetical protein